MKRSTKRVVVSAGALVLVLGVLGGVKAAQFMKMKEAGESFRPPPETVTTATVASSQWQQTVKAIGSVASVQGVIVSAELGGTVEEINFESGGFVEKGAVLVRLDTSIENAQLAAARADAGFAKVNLERISVLAEKGAVTRAELDQARATADRSGGQARSLQATIAKKTIRAPFSGHLGIRRVNLGQVLAPGAPIVALEQLDPLFVDFTLPQRALGTIAVGQDLEAHADAFPKEVWRGKISAIDPLVDETTRSVNVRGVVSNATRLLRPGMFVSVDLIRPDEEPVLIIPATAVIFAPYGNSVFVVEETKDQTGARRLIAKQQFVRLGQRRGDFVAVQSGLKVGQIVVTSGAFKLKNGMPVTVDNRLAPPASGDPRPSES